jgi:hypothetical protein
LHGYIGGVLAIKRATPRFSGIEITYVLLLACDISLSKPPTP